MNNLLHKAYDPDQFRKEGHALVEQLATYLENSISGATKKVIKWKQPDDLYDQWKDYLQKGVSSEQFFSDLINQSIQLHNPRYMGHQVAVPLPVTALASMVGSLLNNGTTRTILYREHVPIEYLEKMRATTDSLRGWGGGPSRLCGCVTMPVHAYDRTVDIEVHVSEVPSIPLLGPTFIVRSTYSIFIPPMRSTHASSPMHS